MTNIMQIRVSIALTSLLFAAACAGGGGGGADTAVPRSGPGIAVTTPAPTPTPAPLTTNPTSLNFTIVGETQTFDVNESGYVGTFTIDDDCSGIATVTTSDTTGPNTRYKVAAVAAGTCQVTIKDAARQTAGVGITVTTTSGSIH